MFLVQRAARHFGLAVDSRALALCAVMALIVNFSAILLSVYLTFNHLMMLVFMVVASAALVTGLNEYLLRRQYARVSLASTREKQEKTAPTVLETEELPIEAEPIAEAPEPLPASTEKVVWEVDLPVEPIPAPVIEEPKNEPKFEPVVEIPKAEPKPEPVFEIPKPEPEPEPVVEEPKPESEPEPVIEEPKPEPEPEPVAEIPEPEPEPEPVAEEPEPEEEPTFSLDLPEDLVTLDDYLDFAYTERDAGRTAKAAAAYQAAIEGFPDDPYLPFLVIELGNLYKEAGAYDVAADTYRDALSLPIIQGQTGLVDEFRKNIAYLEAVSHITARHDAPDTPFSQIPPAWIAEIEADFAKRTGN